MRENNKTQWILINAQGKVACFTQNLDGNNYNVKCDKQSEIFNILYSALQNALKCG